MHGFNPNHLLMRSSSLSPTLVHPLDTLSFVCSVRIRNSYIYTVAVVLPVVVTVLVQFDRTPGEFEWLGEQENRFLYLSRYPF